MVGNSMWEFEFCPKYRYRMFGKWKYRKLVEACLRRAASEHEIKWTELNVQPDHVQGTAKIPMTMAPVKALQLLKGRFVVSFLSQSSGGEEAILELLKSIDDYARRLGRKAAKSAMFGGRKTVRKEDFED